LLQHKVLFPFLLPLFFVLNITRFYFGGIPAVDAAVMAAIYIVVAAGVYCLFRLFIKNNLVAGLATSVLFVLWLYWVRIIRTILERLHMQDDYGNYPIVLIIYFVLGFGLCWFMYRVKAKAAERVLYYLNTLFALFVLMELVLISIYTVEVFRKPLITSRPNELRLDTEAKAGDNIYLLLFDEYASTLSLKEDWGGYDNSAMDSFLVNRGFFINKHSRSNYCWSEFSMASLFYMDYFNDLKAPLNYTTIPEKRRSMSTVRHARVAKVLHHAGYQLKAFSLFPFYDQPRQKVGDIMISERELITFRTFGHYLLNEYIPRYKYGAQMKADSNFLYPPFYQMNTYNDQAVSTVIQEAKSAASRPKFVYAHFMMPHARYFYDSADRLMPMYRMHAIKEKQLQYYKYNVAHTNKKLRQMVDTILKYDRQAAIIVLGDHGFRRDVEYTQGPEYFRNMSAIYFPDRDYRSFPDSFSNVNVFRLVLNKVCGTRYPLIEDKQYNLVLKK
jgi:hypothetical protein